jgi:hypothetical protein
MSLRSDVKHDDDLLYYNAVLYNTSTLPLVASISDIRGQSLIDRPEDWHMSVVRFVLSSQLIPLGRVPLAGGTSTLRLTVRFGGVDYSDFVLPPVVPYFLLQQDLGAFMTYDQLLLSINSTWAGIFAGIPGLPVGTVYPRLAYNAATGLITLYFQQSFIGTIDLFMSEDAYNYVYGMPALYLGAPALAPPAGQDWQIELDTPSSTWVPIAVRDGYPTSVQAASMPGQVIALSQQAPSQSLWDAANSVYLTTSTIPIQSEYAPFNTSQSQNAGFSTASNPIISDFALDSESPLLLRQKIEYLPTAEYRMIHLAGRESLKKIDIQFWYVGANGRPYQVYLAPGQSCSVKLLFRRHFESS